MSDLRHFVVLQARLYEFLEQQDEGILQAIVDGTLKLAVAPADSVSHPTPVAPAETRSSDPAQAAQDLSKLSSEQERRSYLNTANLDVPGLKRVAKLLGLSGYSKFARARLVDLLAGYRPKPTGAPDVRPADETTEPNVDAAAIASHLRETETEEEGAAYLRTQNLDRESLLAVAAELQLTRVERLSQKELRKRVLEQAIGARRRFAGLRKW